MTAIWSGLGGPAQIALRAVHHYGSATVAAAEHSAVSRATLQKAQTTLSRDGLIELDDRRGPLGGSRFRLVDPLLGDWIEQRRG